MDINKVITQLRTYCPALGTRVGGAANFDNGAKDVIAFADATGKLVYPAAVVVPLEDDADSNTSLDGLAQIIVTERIAVIIEFDSAADRRGQGAVDQVEAMKYQLYSALLNWQVDRNKATRGMYYVGGHLLSFDRARLFWQFVFALDVMITDADGFPIQGDPLTIAVSDPAAPIPTDGSIPLNLAITLTP